MSQIADRLAELGLELPPVAAPLAAYVPALVVDGLGYTSGQLPTVGGKLARAGKLGEGISIEDGQAMARTCILNGLAALAHVLGGDLDRIERVVKVTGFVASGSGFTDQPKVVNGASELLLSIFGDAGKHVRSAVGVAELPIGAPVEIEMVVQIRK